MDKNYKAILDLIGDIYEAAITPDHWSVAIEKLAIITRSKSAVLVLHDREMKEISFQHSYGIPKPILALHNSPLGKLDPGLKVMQEQPPGTAINMYRIDDREKVPKLIYELITRLTDRYFFGGVNCFNDETWHAGIGLHRTREEGEFESEILELLEELVPHFQRAMRIQKEFFRLQLQQSTMQAELDRHIIGLILLDEHKNPIYSNPMANKILKRHSAISLRNNSLHAYDKDEDKQLQFAISAAAKAAPDTVEQSHHLGLKHPDHATPLAALVIPAPPHGIDIGITSTTPRVAVYLTDPDDTILISHDSLKATYGLSQRESMVAIAIANGQEVSEIAKQHNVSVQTVRSQLKSIFNKTGVNRQVDLIRLLLNKQFVYDT